MCPAGHGRGFNKGRSSKFREGSWVRQTPEEGRRTYRLKRCGNIYKDEDNSPKTFNDKNQQDSSQKFRQLICIFSYSILKCAQVCLVLLQRYFFHCFPFYHRDRKSITDFIYISEILDIPRPFLDLLDHLVSSSLRA